MISWARLALGQTQEAAEQETAPADEAIHPWPEQSGATPEAATPASGGSAWTQQLPRLLSHMAIATAVAAVTFLFVKQGQRAHTLERQLASAQEQVGRLQEQHRELTQQLSSVQAERSTLDERVFSLSLQLSSAAAELRQANERLAATQESARELHQAQEQRETALARVTSERDASRREAEDLKRGQDDLTRSVTHLRQRLALLDRDYRELSAQFAALSAEPHEPAPALSGFAGADLPPAPLARAPSTQNVGGGQAGVELSPVLVGNAVRVSESERRPAGPLQGRVVNVNERQRFVIIDKGSADGVREGMVFDIVRHGASVGRATAVRLHSALAACNLLSDGRAAPVMAGDLVVQHDKNHQ